MIDQEVIREITNLEIARQRVIQQLHKILQQIQLAQNNTQGISESEAQTKLQELQELSTRISAEYDQLQKEGAWLQTCFATAKTGTISKQGLAQLIQYATILQQHMTIITLAEEALYAPVRTAKATQSSQTSQIRGFNGNTLKELEAYLIDIANKLAQENIIPTQQAIKVLVKSPKINAIAMNEFASVKIFVQNTKKIQEACKQIIKQTHADFEKFKQNQSIAQATEFNIANVANTIVPENFNPYEGTPSDEKHKIIEKQRIIASHEQAISEEKKKVSQTVQAWASAEQSIEPLTNQFAMWETKLNSDVQDIIRLLDSALRTTQEQTQTTQAEIKKAAEKTKEITRIHDRITTAKKEAETIIANAVAKSDLSIEANSIVTLIQNMIQQNN